MSELEQLAQQQARREDLTFDVAEFCEKINSVLQLPTPEEKQQVLHLVGDHVLVGKEQLTIKHVMCPISAQVVTNGQIVVKYSRGRNDKNQPL